MLTTIYCHDCGGHASSDFITVKCGLCESKKISFNMKENNEEDMYFMGFISCHNDNLFWTEFNPDKTIVYALAKNYSVIPTLCYDINNGIIIDPITENKIDLKNLFSNDQ